MTSDKATRGTLYIRFRLETYVEGRARLTQQFPKRHKMSIETVKANTNVPRVGSGLGF